MGFLAALKRRSLECPVSLEKFVFARMFYYNIELGKAPIDAAFQGKRNGTSGAENVI
jgi:hypothetical protein